MRIGSLFSGIGGLELGLERAGVGRTLWQCEADPFARRVLARHWPDATIYPDVCAMGREEEVPRVEVICGGFPCQDISLAGRGAGLDGERSGLFFELLRVVRLVRPRYVVLENVAAILTRGLGAVLGALAESGYDAWWDCIPAQAVGAPHRRDRWFCVAYASGERRGSDRTAGHESNGEDARRQEGAGRVANGCKNAAYSVASKLADTGRDGWQRGEGPADARGVARAGSSLRREGGQQAMAARDRGAGRRALRAAIPADGVGQADAISHRSQGFAPALSATRAAHGSDGAWDRTPTESRMGRTIDGFPARMDFATPRTGDLFAQVKGRPNRQSGGAHYPVERWERDTPRVAPRGPDHRHRLKALGNAVVPQVAEVIGRQLLAIERGLT